MSKDKGYYHKYNVHRVDGRDMPGQPHENCMLFVLDMTHDAHTIPAIKAYAESCKTDLPMLHFDLIKWLKENGHA